MSKLFQNARYLTLMAIFITIIIVMAFIPYTGYISYGVLSITTLNIPVIIAIIMLG
jgi:hypothetical protein